MQRWCKVDEMLVGKIDQRRLSLVIVDEFGALNSFILKPTEAKTFQPNQDPLLLDVLLNTCDLHLRPAKDVFNIIGVLLCSCLH